MNVLITRPAMVAGPLIEAVSHLDLNPIFFPTIDIQPMRQMGSNQEAIKALPLIDIFIFISQSAVKYGLSFIKDSLGHSALHQKKWVAIGPQTARALEREGISVNILPNADESTTEGLLKVKELQNISDQNIMIVKGRGGREQLKTTLLKRKAIIHEYIVYERCLPAIDTRPVRKLVENNKVQLVVITSSESLDNLIQLLAPIAYECLTSLTILVISHRLVDYASAKGFQNIIRANSASTEDIIKTVDSWQSCLPVN